MKDLYNALQDSICYDGKEYRIDTDFRTWLRLSKGKIKDLTDIFIGSSPCFYFCGKLIIPEDVSHALEDFFYNRTADEPGEAQACEGNDQENLIDFDLDSDYIYASFVQAYAIDLIDIEYLHMHKFMALLNGLPETTIMSQIIKIRGYKGDDKEMIKLKKQYALPRVYTEREKELDAYFESVWG